MPNCLAPEPEQQEQPQATVVGRAVQEARPAEGAREEERRPVWAQGPDAQNGRAGGQFRAAPRPVVHLLRASVLRLRRGLRGAAAAGF